MARYLPCWWEERFVRFGVPQLDEQAALRSIVEGTATGTGQQFFTALVDNLSRAMGTLGAWVAVYREDRRELTARAMKMGDDWLDGFVYRIDGTPCQTAIEQQRQVHIPDRVLELYPGDPDLAPYGAVSYMGVPLFDGEGRIIGQLAVLHDKPMPAEPRALAIFRIFANRAAAELQRLKAEAELRDREIQLSLLIDNAMDAIINLDGELRVLFMNAAAEKVLASCVKTAQNDSFPQRLTQAAAERLQDWATRLRDTSGERSSVWIPDGLQVCAGAGEPFQAEATLSYYTCEGQPRYTLILRNINDRLEAEAKIRSLTSEREYLREQLREAEHFDKIIGTSQTLLRALRDLEQVSATDTTVLLLGETGTGKELFARALHASSKRREQPLIKLNCAAIPTDLIESELFGHEKGAFTGATAKREGRFRMADGGTLFLDEVGELPVALQAKLLRVLQEGEFEPVGSSHTCKVDVRVVAATNRDLAHEVLRGRFREDLFYRLNVFPIKIPPLRERKEDIALLAQSFADTYASRLGRTLAPLGEDIVRRLQAYDWPGNIRELQNVIERGVILAQDGRFDLERTLPGVAKAPTPARPAAPQADQILTVEQMQQLERENLTRALESTGWKVTGEQGAARLLGMNPSTLNSRIRALGLKRPHRS